MQHCVVVLRSFHRPTAAFGGIEAALVAIAGLAIFSAAFATRVFVRAYRTRSQATSPRPSKKTRGRSRPTCSRWEVPEKRRRPSVDVAEVRRAHQNRYRLGAALVMRQHGHSRVCLTSVRSPASYGCPPLTFGAERYAAERPKFARQSTTASGAPRPVTGVGLPSRGHL